MQDDQKTGYINHLIKKNIMHITYFNFTIMQYLVTWKKQDSQLNHNQHARCRHVNLRHRDLCELLVFTVIVLLKIQVFWVDMLCQLVNIFWCFKSPYCLCPSKC